MAEILPIRRKTLTNQSINQSILHIEPGTVLTKICSIKKYNQVSKLWYFNVCNFKI